MYSEVTCDFVRSLNIYCGKDVCLYYTGGIRSTALLLGLKAAGAKSITVVHFILDLDHENVSQDLLAVRNVCSYLDIKFTTVKLKVNSKSNWVKRGKVDKLPLIVQHAASVMSGTEDYVLLANGKDFKVSLMNLRNTLTKGNKVANSIRTNATLMLPMTDTSTLKACTIVGDLSDLLEYPNLPRMLSFCKSFVKDHIINGRTPNCGKCPSCKALGKFYEYFGFDRNVFFKLTLDTISSIFTGDEYLTNVLIDDQVATVAINEKTDTVREICRVERFDEHYADYETDNIFVGEWSYRLRHFPKNFKGKAYSQLKQSSITQLTKLKTICNSLAIKQQDVALDTTLSVRINGVETLLLEDFIK